MESLPVLVGVYGVAAGHVTVDRPGVRVWVGDVTLHIKGKTDTQRAEELRRIGEKLIAAAEELHPAGYFEVSS